MSIVIPYYCKEKLFAIEMETFLPKMTKIANQGFSLSLPAPPPPASVL